ncbi:M48 family metalloprotease [Sphingomonas sp. Tas61C01]|uniref:M48 family metalloprotease n=1 Tax=Sphingomonas sp. Tas61C01 TaxID=3458297 RepID=UPI00403E538E
MIRRVALAGALLLAGCGEPAPDDGPPQVTAEDRALGAEQHPKLLAEFGGAYPGEEARYVSAIGDRIATAAGLPGQCTFTLVNSDVVNAFAVPGCYIYVTRGLVAVMTNEAELASVIGHEVGHIVASHSQRQQRRSLWRRLGVIAVGLTGSDRLTRLAGQAAQYFTLRYSRNQENEADDLGVRYLRATGYDPYAAAEMLGALGRQQRFMLSTDGRDEARSIPEWTLSHPLTEHRIERTRAAAKATGLADGALPERAAPFLAEVDGLLYGDDPEQGFVLGRRFAHPVMRIFFAAPEGFSLTNSPQAIRLSGPDGVAGEFGGGTLPPGGIGNYAELLARHVVSNGKADVIAADQVTINGLPAVIMQLRLAVQQGAVPLSIAVYDGGQGRAYHFIMISPPANRSAAALAALFASFRPLSDAEVAQLRPRVIRTVRAGPGDSVDTLSRRMADPAPRALFLMLNGRDEGRRVKAGELVKIVTYADGR